MFALNVIWSQLVASHGSDAFANIVDDDSLHSQYKNRSLSFAALKIKFPRMPLRQKVSVKMKVPLKFDLT